MARILYVHGAGNRAADAVANGDALRARLRIVDRPELLTASTWGRDLGPDAALAALDRTLPDRPVAGGFQVPGGAALVGTLPDALAPLRAMAPPQTAAGLIPPRPTDADQLLAYLTLGGLDLSAAGLSAEDLAKAARSVARSPEYRNARGAPGDIIEATAVGVVARALERQPKVGLEAGFAGLDLGWIGDRLGDVAEAVMGGGPLAAIGAWAVPTLTPPLSLWTSRKLVAKRRSAMHSSILPAVDVLFYQRKGAAIREHVRREIRALDRPRLVMGHSLGGIILVDALFGPGAPSLDVALLVTFGSQSAFLESFDGLDGVAPNVPWLNIWATYDFVSFLNEGTWAGRVEDRELKVEVGFPAAHGAYYSADAFGEMIRQHPRAAGVFA